MLLMILFLSILVISIIAAIVFSRLEDTHITFAFTVFKWVFVSVIAISGLTSLLCGFMCMGINSRREETRQELAKDVVLLTSQYDILSAAEDGYTKYVAVEQYNEKVKEFKTKVRDGQNTYKNPWTSWFSTPVYLEFSEDMVSYITLN